MARATVLTLPWGGHGTIPTRGWCVLHRQRPSCGELDPSTLRVFNPLLLSITRQHATDLQARWAGEMNPMYLAHWTERLIKALGDH